jgi:transcriptional regulator with XRE-family HTH domain
MESTVKQRLVQFIKMMHLTQKAFEERCGMGNGYVNSIRKGIGPEKMQDIIRAFPELNREWLLFGEGNPLKTTPTISGDITVNGNHNSHIGHASAHCENCGGEIVSDVQELQGAPVIPTALCREGGCDILEYIEENPEEVEISPIRAKGVTIDLWYRIRASDNSNSPTYMPGDNIALASYPKGEERPRPGRFYVVDTYSNGFELGILYPTDGGDFRMQKKNREEFPDFIIERDDIIRIYRVIMMVRI